MVAQLAEIQWPAARHKHVRTSRNEPASNSPPPATGVRRETGRRDRPPTGVLVVETPAIVARAAAIRARIVVEAQALAQAEIVSGTVAFPVAQGLAAPVG